MRRSRPLSRNRALTAAAVCAVAAASFLAGWLRRWNSEDAFITFRVVEQLLHGHGPVFNIGERVEAYSSPAWLALLAVVRAVRLPLEQTAVSLGLLLAAVGFALALRASWLLAGRTATARTPRWTDARIPLGALVLAVLPPVWDFQTSGLETGLAFAWLGLAFLRLVRRILHAEEAPAVVRPPSFGDGVLLGVGALVRPELTIVAVVFATAHILASRRSARRVAVFIAGVCSLPGAYLIFRMGYFASLVPNTALAKEAASANWRQGLAYVGDFVRPYALWLPLPVLSFVALQMRDPFVGWRGRALARSAALVAGALYLLYVVRLGGDFMHGRFLVLPLFCLLLPVLVIDLGRVRVSRQQVVGSAAVIVAWAVLSAAFFRVPYAGRIGPRGIADERGVWVRVSGLPHPVTAGDYALTSFGRDGASLRGLAAAAAAGRAPRSVRLDLGSRISDPPSPSGPFDAFDLAPSVDPRVPLVVGRWNIGIAGYASGLDVHLVDRLGLADPIASRLSVTARGRPSHEKILSNAWIIARWSDETPPGQLGVEVAAARLVLDAPALRSLEDAVTAPLTARRFFHNMRRAAQLSVLRIPPDPVLAEREFGGS